MPNDQTDHAHIAAAAAIDCAIVRAGPCVLLAIERRTGRYPVQLQSVYPQISWLCADGKTERLALSANTSDLERLVQEVSKDGLLVAELDDISSGPADCATHWLLQDTAGVAQRPRSRG